MSTTLETTLRIFQPQEIRTAFERAMPIINDAACRAWEQAKKGDEECKKEAAHCIKNAMQGINYGLYNALQHPGEIGTWLDITETSLRNSLAQPEELSPALKTLKEAELRFCDAVRKGLRGEAIDTLLPTPTKTEPRSFTLDLALSLASPTGRIVPPSAA